MSRLSVICAATLTLALAATLPLFAQSDDGAESAPPATTSARTHHVTRHHEAAGDSTADVEPANARLKLKSDAWVYSKPTKWSKNIERVHAPKFVEVTGSTKNYLQVKLKSGDTGYISPAAVYLTTPADKDFTLSGDSPVYSAPNRWGKKIAEVHRGRNVHVVGLALNYLKIRMKSGIEGYIPQTVVE